jgi:aspartate racemase
MSKYRTIGILGGMGPEATAELYTRIIRLYQTEEGAVDDADFPNILINNVPAEDMLNDLAKRRPVIVSQLQRGVQVLENAGAEFVAIPCNTAMLFLDEIKDVLSIPVIDITTVTAQQVKKLGSKSVGMLASTSTIKTKLYQDKLNSSGIAMLKPSNKDQQEVNQVIMRVLAGQKNAEDKEILKKLATQMMKDGADSVVLGCTELPLILSKVAGVSVVDTLDVLARAIVDKADRTQKW